MPPEKLLSQYGPLPRGANKKRSTQKAKSEQRQSENPAEANGDIEPDPDPDSARPRKKQKVRNFSGAAFRSESVPEYLGIKKTHFYELLNSDVTFPGPISYGARARFYLKSELDAWLKSKADIRDAGVQS